MRSNSRVKVITSCDDGDDCKKHITSGNLENVALANTANFLMAKRNIKLCSLVYYFFFCEHYLIENNFDSSTIMFSAHEDKRMDRWSFVFRQIGGLLAMYSLQSPAAGPVNFQSRDGHAIAFDVILDTEILSDTEK